MGAVPGAGAGLELGERVGDAEEPDEDEVGSDGDVVDGVADSELDSDAVSSLDDVGSAGEFCAVLVAGAVVVGEDGGAGVVSRDDEAFVSSPSVVVPDVCEWVTSADTGFCPINSIPVTIAMATANTETAYTPTRPHRGRNRLAGVRRGSRYAGSVRTVAGASGACGAAAFWRVTARRSRSFVFFSEVL